jgi:glycosyltransferase involved in cell wall biosynthesis
MNAPTVSLCLLTYKRAGVLPRSIESLLAQTFGDFELVINDDCSPDDTEAVCRAYAARDSRVRYFRNERNLRYAGNQNAAVSRARGEFIAFVHDGDVYRADMVEKWVASLRAHPSAGIVFNAVRIIEEHGVPASTVVHDYPPLIPGRQLGHEMLSRTDSPIFGIVMTRAAALRGAGSFDEAFPFLADVDMWFRILLQHDAAYVAEPLYDVMPRERGHANRRINWGIIREQDTIHIRNARRYADAQPASTAFGVAAVVARLQRNNRWLVLKCLTRGEVFNAFKGAAGMLAGTPPGTLNSD